MPDPRPPGPGVLGARRGRRRTQSGKAHLFASVEDSMEEGATEGTAPSGFMTLIPNLLPTPPDFSPEQDNHHAQN